MDIQSGIPIHGVFTKAGLAVGTTTTLTTSAIAIYYALLGKMYTVTGAANQASPTTDFVTGAAFVSIPAGSGSIFAIGRDSGGTMRAIQGTVELLDGTKTDGNNKFVKAPQFGPLPTTFAAYGYVVVKVGSAGSAWVFGTSNFAGPPANTIITYTDVASLPSRPQVD